jgi:TatD DNase family protein
VTEHLVAGWFDSHCHLQEQYRTGAAPEPLTAALSRSAAAGVEAMVCVGTDADTSTQALDLARAWATGSLGARVPALWATMGLHPHEASAGTDEVAARIDAAVARADGALVAVGECGLDYHYEHSPRPAQRQAFAEQIALASRHNLALVIHARAAWDDLFEILAVEGVPTRTVLHCFTGGPDEARRCLDAGMFLSFSGIVTFKNAVEVREAAALCPLDRLLVETDSPFLAPVPHRGRPNEPALVPLVGAAVAAAKDVAVATVAAASAIAARAAFAL